MSYCLAYLKKKKKTEKYLNIIQYYINHWFILAPPVVDDAMSIIIRSRINVVTTQNSQNYYRRTVCPCIV